MPHRVIDAELWGRHEDVHIEEGLRIRRLVGAYGTLYEVECMSMWRLWRLHAVMDLMQRGATYREYSGDDEEDEEDDGFVLHYWKEHANDHHAPTGGNWPPSQIRKPAK